MCIIIIIFAENQKQVDKDDIEKEYDQRRAGIGSAAVLAQRRCCAADDHKNNKENKEKN